MPDNSLDASPDLGSLLRNAPMATLVMVPLSKAAAELEETLVTGFLEAEKGIKPRHRARSASAARSLRSTISAFAADLVLHSACGASGGYCYRSFNREAFTETVATYTQFEPVVDVWRTLGFIEVVKGKSRGTDFEGAMIWSDKGWATRFRPTKKLIRIVADLGITPSAVGEHYAAEKDRAFPIELRAKKKSWGAGSGKRMKLNKKLREVQLLAGEVREINQFLSQFTFSLGNPPHFRRIFNNGDQPGFQWDQGGRLYADGRESYQQKNSDFRKTITIDGEATVELDIRSSQLTIAYGLAGEPLPEGDLYEIEDLPREVVKALVTAIIGKGSRPTKWPVGFAKDHLKTKGRKVGQSYILGATVDLVVKKHPLLLRLGGLGLDVYRLQYVESQILLRAILRLLREAQVPSLPVHDCLIVRERDEELARIILEEEFTKEVGIPPTITAK